MKSYLYKNRKENIENSSSGGAFKKIISTIGTKDAIIYGATWSDDLQVVHTFTSNKNNLQQFSESKYARSKMSDSFKHIANLLLDKKTVVFSGTPCQIAGLKQFLKIKNIDTSNLYLVDIICHGTPSPLILSEWIKSTEKRYKHQITSLSFRDKEIGWIGYPTKVILDNGKVIRHTYKTQEYIRLFFTHAVLGPSCYNCPFSNMNRRSDITIGDFWGVEYSFPNVNPDKGVSLILANSEKGIALLKRIQDNLSNDEVLIECMSDSFLPYQHNLNRPTDRPAFRDDFWKTYKDKGFDYTVKHFGVSSGKGNVKFDIKSVLSKLGLYNKAF